MCKYSHRVLKFNRSSSKPCFLSVASNNGTISKLTAPICINVSDSFEWLYLLWCLLQRREFCRGCPPWQAAGSWWVPNWARRVRRRVHLDYDYIARTPGMVHRYRCSPRPLRYPGMSTSVAVRPHWSPPSPESAPPVLRSATWQSTPVTIQKNWFLCPIQRGIGRRIAVQVADTFARAGEFIER